MGIFQVTFFQLLLGEKERGGIQFWLKCKLLIPSTDGGVYVSSQLPHLVWFEQLLIVVLSTPERICNLHPAEGATHRHYTRIYYSSMLPRFKPLYPLLILLLQSLPAVKRLQKVISDLCAELRARRAIFTANIA